MPDLEKVRRPRMRSWEADEDVARLLDLAVRTTGASIREIVNESVRVHAPGLIRRLLSERNQAERELVDFLGENFPASKATVADESQVKSGGETSKATYRKRRERKATRRGDAAT